MKRIYQILLTLLAITFSSTSYAQYYNELGIDISSNQYTSSIYFKKYWGNSAKFSSHLQFGAPATSVNLHNLAITFGSNWYLKNEGKKLSFGAILQVQKIDEEGYISESDPSAGAPQGPFHYSNKGIQVTLAPEVGWNFTLSKAIYLYPYVIPFAATYIDGTSTKDYIVDPNAKTSSPLNDGIRTTLAQSIGIKLGFRF